MNVIYEKLMIKKILYHIGNVLKKHSIYIKKIFFSMVVGLVLASCDTGDSLPQATNKNNNNVANTDAYVEPDKNIDTNYVKKKITNKKAKIYLIKAKDIQFIKSSGPFTDNKTKLPTNNVVMDKTIEYAYSEELYKDYFDEMSFGNLKMSFEKGTFLEIDSYPVVEDKPEHKALSYKVIDVVALSYMLQKIIPKEDILKYDPLMFHLITSSEVQYTSSGVVVPREIEIDGKIINNNFFMFQVQNEGILDSLQELKEETLMGSSKATIVHEIFHTFGFLRHANTFENNKIVSYGNVFDVLGYTSLSVNLNPGIRDTFKWLDSSNTIYMNINKPTSQNITLHALNGKTGKRVVKIQTSIKTSYYLSFLGEDKWFITNLKPNEDYSTYTGFKQSLTKELINENKKGLFIVKEDGENNELIKHNKNDIVSVFKQNNTYENELFTIDAIKLKGNNSINFNINIK